MASYAFSTWETMILQPVASDTQFIILDHRVSSSPELETTGIVYNGNILSGFRLTNLNEILSQWFKPVNITFTNGLDSDQEYYMSFYIYYTTNNWTSFTYDVVTVTYDWSYGLNSGDMTDLSYPISNLLDYRQYFVYSIYADEPMTLTVNIGNTTIDTYSLTTSTKYNYVKLLSTISFPGEFNFDYSYDYLVNKNANGLKQGDYYDLTINGQTYIVTKTCYNYCVYYMNQLGGWDSLLFEGKTIQSDKLSRLSYKTNYRSMSKDYNKVDYLTTIQETWQLTTAFLNDINSDKMEHLLSSNNVYLHDLNTGQIIPVNITNITCDHKTFKNQNRKLYSYTVEVSASQPKYRI